MKHRILVAGGAGYIGSHVQKQLLEDGFEVAVFDDLSSGDRKNILPGAAFIEGNILDKAALNAAMRQEIDGVVHLAAKKAVGESMVKPELYAENNISGSINILNAMAENGVKHIVFSSSAAVYGMPEYVPIDEDHRIAPSIITATPKSPLRKICAGMPGSANSITRRCAILTPWGMPRTSPLPGKKETRRT